MNALNLKIPLVGAASVLALSLAGCKEEYGAGRIAVPDPTPAAFASAPMGLPYAEPAPVEWYAPERGYAWAERAYGMQRAFHEVPPDYAFDYGGMQPWVWETADDWAMYAEPWDDGYRYYYYEPDAAYPYFVRDGMYGYGFDPTGLLVALLDANGNYLPQQAFYDVAPLAGRYYAHGRDLRNAAFQASPIYIDEPLWVDRAPLILATSDPWIRAATYDDDWQAFRARTGQDELKRFLKEEKRREKEARKWAREIRRDDDFARRYAAAAAIDPRAYREAARAEARAWDESRRFAGRDRDERKRFADAAREERKRAFEFAREEDKRAAEHARESQKRAFEAAREERKRADGFAREEHKRAAERAREDGKRWAEAHARQVAAVERGGGGGDRGGWKAEGRGGGGDDRGKGGGDKGHGGGGGDRGKGGEGKGGGKKD